MKSAEEWYSSEQMFRDAKWTHGRVCGIIKAIQQDARQSALDEAKSCKTSFPPQIVNHVLMEVFEIGVRAKERAIEALKQKEPCTKIKKWCHNGNVLCAMAEG